MTAHLLDSSKLIDKLKERSEHKTDIGLAKYLGINQPSLTGWRRNGVSELKLANAFASTRKQAVKEACANSIRPIVEIYPIENGQKLTDNPIVFEADGKYKEGLRDALKTQKSGVYVFYDTRGKALYTGKTKVGLWNEINLAFRRKRPGQDITLVYHPLNNVEFKAASEKTRQPHEVNMYLYELAAYFSAYAVHEGMVDAVEALLIRAFPNDTFNVRMEKFAKKKPKKKVA